MALGGPHASIDVVQPCVAKPIEASPAATSRCARPAPFRQRRTFGSMGGRILHPPSGRAHRFVGRGGLKPALRGVGVVGWKPTLQRVAAGGCSFDGGETCTD